ncbi:hypothetical protein ACFQZZ_01380 [Nocardia sp. GCM10030253]|uniref:hypothetical protein n=1 Tax=Nocardia sp. GCM10030253 TaxID=3273404 RepID=UPI003642FF00
MGWSEPVCSPAIRAGYPVGAAEVATWHGALHGVASGVAGVGLLGFCAVAFRRLRSEGNTAGAVVSAVVFVVFAVLPFTIPGSTSVTFAIASFIARGWVAVFAAGLRTQTAVTPQTHVTLA